MSGGAARQLTTDGKSLSLLWGPDQIAYTRYRQPTGKHRHEDGPKYNLFLIDPATGLSRRLTNDKAPYLLTGLTPTFWSLDGTKLLAEFGGQDTAYGVRVDPNTGDETKFPTYRDGRIKLPVIPAGISDDGTRILAYTGYADAFEGDVVTLPYAGGPPTGLVRVRLRTI